MIKPGRPVKDIEIKKDTSIDKIFNEMSQSGGFESTSLSAGLEVAAKNAKRPPTVPPIVRVEIR